MPKAQLQGADLRQAKLQRADLSQAQLQRAELGFAQLQGADLSYAELQSARLTFAQLQGADLRGAQLWGANLSHAQLQGAYLYKAEFQGAELSNVQWQGVSCANKSEDLANLAIKLIKEQFYFSFEERIKERADQESDFSTVVFKGGLKLEDIERIKNKLQPYTSETELEDLTKKLEEHVDKEPSNKPPEGVEKGSYTEGQAKEWIAKYEAAMPDQDEDQNQDL